VSESFEQWAILELMGHVRLAGKVTEEEHFGAKLGRIDIPNGEGFTTQWFSGGSIYRLTPTTEEIARGVALRNQPEPVHRWELPAPVKMADETGRIDHEDYFDERLEDDDADDDE
jgi:hypothetical protein